MHGDLDRKMKQTNKQKDKMEWRTEASETLLETTQQQMVHYSLTQEEQLSDQSATSGMSLGLMGTEGLGQEFGSGMLR